MAVKTTLQDLRVLVIEDEALVAMLLEDVLSDIGCRTAGIAANLAEAQSKASTLSYDAVVLDVNLHGETTFSLADWLTDRNIPFLFSTGYGAGGIPDHLRAVPVLQKPFQDRELAEALNAALTARAA